MKKLFIAVSVLAMTLNAWASASFKPQWNCVSPKGTIKVTKQNKKFLIAGYGELERVNSTEGQGIFTLKSLDDREVYSNKQGDSLVIIQDSDEGPKLGILTVHTLEFELSCTNLNK